MNPGSAVPENPPFVPGRREFIPCRFPYASARLRSRRMNITTGAHTRRYDLDWVRICAFALLILYHVGMYYVTWDWHVKSPRASSSLEPLMLLVNPWRLPLLFLVSGAATSFMLARGGRGLAGARSKRLLVPLIFGMLVVVPPQSYFEVVEQLHYDGSYWQFWGRYLAFDGTFCDRDGCLKLPTWNHLWFVTYLWVYTMVALLALRLAPRDLLDRWSRQLERVGGPWLLLIPAAVLAIARIALRDRFPETHALVGDWYNHAQYFPVFVAGLLLARTTAPWESLRRARFVNAGIALVAYASLLAYYASFNDSHPPPDLLRMAARVAFALFCWAAIVAILGFARAIAPGDSAARRYLTEAIFPFYIIHQTAIVAFAHWLAPWKLPLLIEGALLIGATVVCSVGGFEIVRRVSWLRPLFGLKRETAVTTVVTA